jgi:rod shape-determining protein MreC
VQDKYVRRRRAVLAVLVAASLILLTAYFGEADNSPLHSIQQGIVEVFTPIQEGASKVLSPVRDLSNWVSTTLHAKSENKELVSLNQRDNREVAKQATELQEYQQLKGMNTLTNRLDLAQDAPVYANVIQYDPQVFAEKLQIDKGSGAGIQVNDPVISSAGLVGDVTSVGSDYAIVSGLSSPKFGVFARIIDTASGKAAFGTLEPEVGDPSTLQVNYVPTTSFINTEDEVVTAGFTAPGNSDATSLYPPGIPIGVVSNFNANQLADAQTVNVSPFVNLRNVTQVEILTKVQH